MKNLLIILLSVLLMGCIKYQSEPLTKISDMCLKVESYNKTLCLTTEIDSGNYIYIDNKKSFKNEKSGFKDLTVHVMIVIEIKDHMVTLSNPTNSIENIYFENVPKVEDIFHVICSPRHLKESKLIRYPEVFTDEEGNGEKIIDDEEYLDP